MQSLRFYIKQLGQVEEATTAFDKKIQAFRERYTKIEREHHKLFDEIRVLLKEARGEV